MRERAHGARDTFSHDFDFYVVQTAERVIRPGTLTFKVKIIP